jgi:leucyl-tRNA synthetase
MVLLQYISLMTHNQMKMLCRELRKNMTPSEKILWELIRRRQLRQHRFLRQYPIVCSSINGSIHFYIADFYCHQLKLVIEVDGPIHDYQKEQDYNRDLVMQELGLRVLRIKNDELIDLETALHKITLFIAKVK